MRPDKRPNPSPSMSPDERSLWLASHNAPPEMCLVTQGELNIINDAIKREAFLRKARETALTAIIMQLGEYWKIEPDVVNAVGLAVFDAKRFKAGAEKAAEVLAVVESKLTALGTALPDLPPTAKVDLIDVLGRISAAGAFLKSQESLRRVRVKPQKGANGN